MTTDLLMVLLLLGAAIVMFIANRPRMDAVALLMIVLLPFTGVQMPSSDNGFALVTGPVRFLLTLPSRCARKPPNREIPYASIPAHG